MHMYVVVGFCSERNAIAISTFYTRGSIIIFIGLSVFKHCIAILLAIESGGQRVFCDTYVLVYVLFS